MYNSKPSYMDQNEDRLCGIDKELGIVFLFDSIEGINPKIAGVPKKACEETGDIILVDNKIFLCPYWSAFFYSYDFDLAQSKEMFLSDDVNESMYSHRIGVVGDLIYLYDTSKAEIIGVDIHSLDYKRIKMPKELLHAVNGNDIKFVNSKIYLPCIKRSGIYVIDVKSWNCDYINIAGGMYGLTTISFLDDNNICLSGYGNSLIVYDLVHKKVDKVVDLPKQLKVYSSENGWAEAPNNTFPFIKSVAYCNSIWLFPYLSNVICKYDAEREKFETYEINNKAAESGEKPFEFLIKHGNRFFLRKDNGVLYEMDDMNMVPRPASVGLPENVILDYGTGIIKEDEAHTLSGLIEGIM